MSDPRRLLLCALFFSFGVSRVSAATSGTAITKLQDVPVGKVIQVGFVKFVKAADDAYIATDTVECPDDSWFAGKYVKCWDSEDEYTQTCTGSYYCGTNTSWTSSASKCTAPAGSSYCGDNTTWTSTSSKCIGKTCTITCGANSSLKSGTTDTCTCDSGYYADGSGSTEHKVEGGSCSYTACGRNTFVDGAGRAFRTGSETCGYKKCSGTNVAATYIPKDQFCTCKTGYYYAIGYTYPAIATNTTDSDSCTYYLDANKQYMTNGSNSYWISSKGILVDNSTTACNGTPIGGFCWDTISSSTMTWANRKCTTTSGFSVPTIEQFLQMFANFGCSGIYSTFCYAFTTPLWGGSAGDYWSSSESSSLHAYRLHVNSPYSSTTWAGKSMSQYVRCIKD